MGRILLWFVVPLCLVLALDILIVRRREKMKLVPIEGETSMEERTEEEKK